MKEDLITAEDLSACFIAGAKQLDREKDRINELNVFPVPDGDTGINMTQTILSAAREVKALGDAPEMKALGKAISSGSLRGARGNSGVILSQLFRGFSKVIKPYNELTVPILAEAFDRAAETAYKAVMKPKEGTILTVARRTADKALTLSEGTNDIVSFGEEVLAEAESVLDATPDLLPVLKEAGVVDSGGAGLVEILRGALSYLKGDVTDLTIESSDEKKEETKRTLSYHMSFLLTYTQPGAKKREGDFLTFLTTLGENVDPVPGDHGMKAELDTNAPGEILTRALTLGYLDSIQIRNQDKGSSLPPREESKVKAPEEKAPVERKAMGFVTVSCGEGLKEIFLSIGADYVISGGQTMNPSTDDILKAVEKVDADTVFILPNNKNIILAANQAAELEQDKKLIVIPTKTIPQGVTALVNFIPDQSAEENKDNMTREIENVKTGEVTFSVRDTSIDGKKIKKGDLMGIGDEGLVSVSTDMTSLLDEMIGKMAGEDASLVTLYQGAEIKDDDAASLLSHLREGFPDLEFELEKGGQPVYYYICSIE